MCILIACTPGTSEVHVGALGSAMPTARSWLPILVPSIQHAHEKKPVANPPALDSQRICTGMGHQFPTLARLARRRERKH